MGKQKRANVARTLNEWTMTESEFRAHIISALRQASRWWKPKNKALARARVWRGMYKCELCWKIGPASLPPPKGKKRKIKNILADHIVPIIWPEGFVSYDSWIERCFVPSEQFQAICHECHSRKTKEENQERRALLKRV